MTLFSPSDRLLTHELLQTIGQQALKEPNWRKDPLLFASFAGLNTISRFFFHEQLSVLSYRKLFEPQNLYFLRSYLQLNYEGLVQGPTANEYLKTSWNHLMRSASEVIVGFNKKIDRTLERLQDLFLAFENKQQYISARELEREAKMEVDIEKSESSQILDRMHELQDSMNLIPLARTFQYSFQIYDIFGLKNSLLILDLTKSMILQRPGGLNEKNSDFLGESLGNFVKKPEFEKIFKFFPLIPTLLDNLLILNDFFRNKPIFSLEVVEEMNRIKRLLDELMNVKEGDLVEMIKVLKKTVGGKKIEVELNWNENFLFSAKDPNLYLSDDLPGSNVFREEDLFREKYVVNTRNIVKKALNSKAFYYLMNESVLKNVLHKILETDPEFHNIQKNKIDFPFYCDFMFDYNGRKFILMIQDHHKMILGVEKVLNPYFVELAGYWQRKNYVVRWICYEDYVMESERLNVQLKHLLRG